MDPRDSRHAPLSLRRALLLLGPLAVLGALLLGLASTASADHAFGAPTITVGPPAVGSDSTPEWSFALGTATSATCTLTGPSGVVQTLAGCQSPYIAPALTDGQYSLVVTAEYAAVPPTDPEDPTTGHEAGTADSAPATYLLDTEVPTVSVVDRPGAVYSGWDVVVSTEGSPVTGTCTWTEAGGATGSSTCNTGTVKPALPESGDYTLTVTAVDAAGNPAAPASSSVFSYDGDAPDVAFSQQPSGTDDDRNPEWVYSVVGGGAPTCTLNGPGGASTVDCSETSYTASLTASGSYTLTVSSTDPAGNVGSATSAPAYVLDVTGPSITIDPAGPTTGTAAGISWTVTIGDAASATCALSTGATATCDETGGTVTESLASDGTVTLTVTALDALGNETTASASYTRSTTPGTPTVTVTPTRAQATLVTWSFTTGALTDSVQCRLDGPAGTGTVGECTSFDGVEGTYTATLSTDGTYTLHVFADNATSAGTPSGSASYELDRAEPAGPVLTRTPQSGATGPAPTIGWTWTVATGHTTQCRLTVNATIGTWAPCDGGFSTPTSAQGTYTLQVKYVDDLGNEGTTSSDLYDFDNIKPATPTVTLVGADTRQPGPVTWTVTTVDAVTSECRVIGPGVDESTVLWGACTMPLDLSGSGTHRFEVRHYDAAGNVSDVGVGTVTLDGSAPTAPSVPGTDTRTKTGPLTWSFTQTGDGVSFRCRLVVNGDTSAAFTACTSNYSHIPTVQGTYRLDVVSVDGVGNVSAITQGPTYTYDTLGPAAPTVTLTVTSGKTKSATWSVTPAPDGLTHQCRLTRTANGTTDEVMGWTACSSFTFALNAGDGEYVLEVRSYDDLLNVGAVGTGPGYSLDATAPAQPTVTGSRIGTGSSNDITYAFATEAGGSASCRLLKDGEEVATYASCHLASPFPLSLTHGDGSYRLEVVITDAFGNASTPGLSAAYVLDTAAPNAPLVQSGPPARTTSTTLTWTTAPATTDGGVALECRLVRIGDTAGAFSACAGSYADLTDGSYRLDVRAIDAAGNRSAITSSAVTTVDTTGPGDPVVTLAVTRGNTPTATWSVTPAEAGRVECMLTRTVGTTTSTVTPWGVCTAPYTFALSAGDGVYVLHVRTYDDLLNTSAEVAGPGYTLDATAPATPSVASTRAGTTNSARDITFTYLGEGTATCYLYRGTTLVTPTDAVCGATTYTATLPVESGPYRLEVTFTDDFDNISERGVSGIYTLDVTPPATPTVTGSRTGTDNELGITYTFSGEGTAVCQLFRGTTLVQTWAGCESAAQPFVVTLPAEDGAYTLRVTYTDQYGNVGTAGVSAVYTLDVTPPATPTVTGSRTGTDNELGITYTFSGEGTAVCQLFRGTTLVQTWAGCESAAQPFVVTLPAEDGAYTLRVTYTDQYGNVGTAGVSAVYTLDVTPPATPTVTGSRTGTDNELGITYTFSGEGTAVCQLFRGTTLVQTWAGCESAAQPFVVTLPAEDGAYTLRVTYTDQYGNVGTAGVSAVYTLDVTPPDVPAVEGNRDGETDNERAVSYTFEGEGTATCRLYRDGVLVAPTDADCTDTGYTATLPNASGTYRLEVTFTDQYGNTSAPGVSGDYVLDVTPPGLATVTVTPRTDNVESATWTVVRPEAGTTTECRLLYEGAVIEDWHSCDGPYTYALTEGDGEYVLEVRVIDAVGNTGAVAVGQGYVVDMTPPTEPLVTSNRTVTDNERSVTYAFSGEGIATCQLTRDGVAVGAPVVGCTTGYTITLPNVSGVYVLLVTYTDAVGNVSDPGASPDYDLDVTPPAVPDVTSDRSGTDNERVVTYEFSGEGTATCQLTRDGVAVGAAVTCTSPWVVTLPTTDGEYVLLVTYTDAVGNTSAPGQSVTYVLDLTAPPAPIVLGPPPTGNTRTVTWTYSGEGTATCQLVRDGVAYGAETACGATSFSTTLPLDGTWTLQVSFTDAVGNRGPPGTSSGYLLDTVAPVAPGVTGPTGPAQGRSPAWTLTAEAGTTVQCRLLRAGAVVVDWAACSGTYGADLTGLPDGAYVVEARATDKAGNVGAVGTSAPYVLDTTAPTAPSVTGPSGPSQSRTPGFTWTGEAGTTAECLLMRDGVAVGGWVACTSGYAPTLDRDGTWTLTVRLTDVALNVGASAASGGYVLDTTPPAAPIVTPPQSPGRDLAPSWGVVVEGGTKLECRFTGPDGTSTGWTACSLPYVTMLDGRPDGAYVLEVRATDVAGNLSAVGSGRYVLDTSAPAAAVVTSPGSPGRSRAPSFSWTAEAGSSTRCRLTSGATVISDFAPCTSPSTVDLTGLPDGTYTLTVRVSDAAGNIGESATGTYVLDTTGPDAPVLTLSPASPSAARRTTWAFTYEPGSTLTCRLTSPTGAVRDLAACTSPFVLDLTGQPEGTWTLTVRAVDSAGNVGAVLTLTYVLDLTAVAGPEVTGPVSPGTSRTPRWTISTATITECRLTLGTTVIRDWVVCAGSFTADLFGKPDGTYVLSVRTRTPTGKYSAATTSRYVLDTTPPSGATIVGPPSPSTNRLPVWTVASPELGAKAECKVLLFGSVLRDWAPCAVSPAGSLFTGLNLTGRGDGTYTLVVRLTDFAGNRGPEVSSSYVLDTSAPVGVGVTGPPSPGNDMTPTWTFTSGGATKLECRLTSVKGVVSDWDTCTGSFTADLTGLPDGTYTLAVRAVSAAGTPGPETTSAYVLSTVAPKGPGALALSGTKPTSNDRSPTWTFTLPAGTTGHCVVVSGARTVFDGPCSSPFTLDLSNAQDGSYTLTVKAVDEAGTPSEGVSSTYVLDTVPTASPILTQVPGSTGSTLDPQWRFTVVYGATAECRLVYDGSPIGDWAPCTSPYTATLTGRPDGRYVLEVRAVDAAGNSSAPRASAYVLDRSAPAIATFTYTPPTPSTDRTVEWILTSPDGSDLECRLIAPDRTSSWQDCGSLAGALRLAGSFTVAGARATFSLNLAGRPDGDYVLEVRVVEEGGRRGSVSRATYTLDTRAPAAPRFSSVPPAAGNESTPRWSWDATGDERVECRLVRVGGGPVTDWAPCTSPYEARLTAQGTYALEVRVIDAAGNLSPLATSSYRYDTTAPAAAILTSRPPSGGSDRSVSWTFTVPGDATATCTVTRGLSRVDERTCNGRYDLDLRGLPDSVYTLTIRVTDTAGNVSTATIGRYALSTIGLGGPGRVDPPSPAPTAPTSPGGSTSNPPTGPGRGGTGSAGNVPPRGSTPTPGLPNFPVGTEDPRRSVNGPGTSTTTPTPGGATGSKPESRDPDRARNPLIPDPLPVGVGARAIREAVTGTIARPTLPLALLAIVILFLLAQNRIDRRDPKLASAPVEAEPELDFTTFIRQPGGALS